MVALTRDYLWLLLTFTPQLFWRFLFAKWQRIACLAYLKCLYICGLLHSLNLGKTLGFPYGNFLLAKCTHCSKSYFCMGESATQVQFASFPCPLHCHSQSCAAKWLMFSLTSGIKWPSSCASLRCDQHPGVYHHSLEKLYSQPRVWKAVEKKLKINV